MRDSGEEIYFGSIDADMEDSIADTILGKEL